MTARALGIDIGTSGVRIVALDDHGAQTATAARHYDKPEHKRDPAAWWSALEAAFADLGQALDLASIRALAVDGTSGTVLAVDTDGKPIGPASMYNDPCPEPDLVERIESLAPAASPARGAHSPLARAIDLARATRAAHVLHQADWIALRLGDGVPRSDENNALKSGYDLAARAWPGWIERLDFDRSLLPHVTSAGERWTKAGPLAKALGLSASCWITAGTTDGCAAFLATGANRIGDGVTSLGSTIVLKLLSDKAIEAPGYGIYSHRIGTLWLAGGASNTGGAVLRHYFSDSEIVRLSKMIDPSTPTGHDYYPLVSPGERFPVSDPDLVPRLTPRPADDSVFLQAMLEAMSDIEARGYARLTEMGGPALARMRTVGGGARNQVWERLRQQRLAVPFLPAASTETAAGAARLALGSVQ